VLSGGYIVHNLRDREAFSPVTANPAHKEFDQAMVASCRVTDVGLTFYPSDIHSLCPVPTGNGKKEGAV
jgi:aromatic ring-opening dioxygenase catalytic subunit (LigB family)